MTYAEKLKSSRWQKVRLLIFQRDNFKCRICGKGEEGGIHAHHTIYLPDHEPWEYGHEFILTLCTDHHEDEELLKSEDKMIVTQLLTAGMTRRQMLNFSTELRRYMFGGDCHKKFMDLMDFLNG